MGKYIAFLGVLGSGKSTIAEGVSRATGIPLVPEEFSANPKLQDCFGEGDGHTLLESQLWFLTRELRIQAKLKQQPGCFLKDSSIYHGALIYMGWFFQTGRLDADLYRLYCDFHREVEDLVEPPLAYVHLKADTDETVARICRRGRSHERMIGHPDIEIMQGLADSILERLSSVPSLVIDTGRQSVEATIAESEQFVRKVIPESTTA